MTPCERFEAIGDLYYRATGHLRPGKDSMTEDSSCPENQGRFDQWIAVRGFNDAIARIVELEEKLRQETDR